MITKLSWLGFWNIKLVRLVWCVCVFGIHVLKIAFESWFWEIYLVFGSLVELHAWLHSYLCFSLLEKLFWKAGSTPPRYLAICWASLAFSYHNLASTSTLGGSIEKVFDLSIASRHLVDRSSFCSCFWCFFLDTYSIPEVVDGHFFDTSLDKYLNTSRHLHLSRFTEGLYNLLMRSTAHFLWSLSR